jgi:hypothetical protein
MFVYLGTSTPEYHNEIFTDSSLLNKVYANSQIIDLKKIGDKDCSNTINSSGGCGETILLQQGIYIPQLSEVLQYISLRLYSEQKNNVLLYTFAGRGTGAGGCPQCRILQHV